jgi:hypothetical protein
MFFMSNPNGIEGTQGDLPALSHARRTIAADLLRKSARAA